MNQTQGDSAALTPTPLPITPTSPPPQNGRAETWVLSFAQLVSWGTLYYAFSVFVVPMEHDMGWPRTLTNAAVTVGLLIAAAFAYPIGLLIDRGYGRMLMVAGSLLASAMLALWSQASSLAVVFIAWVGLGAAIAATLYDPVFAVLTRIYPESFRKKITLITLIAGFSSTLFIPLTHTLIDHFGWRHALLVLAAINLLIAVPGNAWAIGRGERTGPRAGTTSGISTTTQHAALVSRASTQRALHTPTFWALVIFFTLYFLTFGAMAFHLVPLMMERRVPDTLILTTMALIGPAQVAARALWYAAGRNLRPGTIGTAVIVALPVCYLLMLCAGTSALLWIPFALIYGGANGMIAILRGTIVQDFMWTEGYGAVSG